MKRIMSGLVYDTGRAVLIGGYQSGGSVNDFQYWEAKLYKTPRAGRYFIHGYGGAMTRFSRPVDGNSWTGGEKIEPMDKQDAFEFAQEYLEPEIVQREFADMVEEA